MKILSLLGPQRQTVLRVGTTVDVGEWVYQVLTPEGIVDLPEDTAKRTGSSKVFPAGTDATGRKQYITEAQNARHYKEAGLSSKGTWLDVDTRPSSFAGQFILEYPTPDHPAFYYTSREGGERIEVRLGDLPLKYDWSKYEDGEDRRTWREVWPGVDIELRLWPDRAGFYKVIKDPKARHTFTFTVTATKQSDTKVFGGETRETVLPLKLRTATGELSAKTDLETALRDGVQLKEIEYTKTRVRDLLAWDVDGKPIETTWTLKDGTRTETIPVQDAKAYPLTVDTDVTEQVPSGSYDGYAEFAGSEELYAAYSYMWVGYNYAYLHLFAGWSTVAVDQGATIDSAKVQYRANGDSSGTVETDIYFNAADNATMPNSYATYMGKSLTAGVGWSPGSHTNNTWYDTPSLVTPLQAVINRVGWATGNTLLLIHKYDTGSSTYAARCYHTYESAAANAPKLVFSWSSGSTTHDAAAALVSNNDLTGAASLSLSLSAALASNNDLSAGATLAHAVAAALESTNTLAATATRIIMASAAFESANALAAAATYLHAAQAALQSVNALTAAGTGILEGAAALEAQQNLAAAATHLHAAVAELQSVNNLAATGTAIREAQAALESVNILTATIEATQTHDVEASLHSANTLTAAATRLQDALAALHSINTLTAAGTLVHIAGAGLQSVNSLGATAVVVQPLSAALVSNNDLAAAGTLLREASAALATDNDLAATGTLIIAASAELQSDNTLTAYATGTFQITGALSATMTLTATATRASTSTLKPPFRVTVSDTRTYAKVDDLRVTVKVNDSRQRAEVGDSRTRTETTDTRTRVNIEG